MPFFLFRGFSLRSNFNSRGVNGRELVLFFGHNSLPYRASWTKIGGMKAISVPDLSITSKPTKNLKKRRKNRNYVFNKSKKSSRLFAVERSGGVGFLSVFGHLQCRITP